jgi:hypothetical protein
VVNPRHPIEGLDMTINRCPNFAEGNSHKQGKPMFDNDEIEFLLIALDAYEQSFNSNALNTSLLSLMILSDKEEAKLMMEQSIVEAQNEANKVKDRIVLMKAKLIQMRDQATIQEAKDFLKSGKSL